MFKYWGSWIVRLVSLHICSMWETTVMHKEVSGWTVNFGPNFPESPFLELKTRKPPPPFRKTSDLGWPKFTLEYPPHFGKLQIWDDQSLLRNTPPILENFRFRMTKVYSGIPPHWKMSESPSPRVSECGELLHVETLSNPDNYSFVLWWNFNVIGQWTQTQLWKIIEQPDCIASEWPQAKKMIINRSMNISGKSISKSKSFQFITGGSNYLDST